MAKQKMHWEPMFPRNKNGNPWALVKLSIEFCRERAAVIGAEEYLTEADGARSLVAFVAGQVLEP